MDEPNPYQAPSDKKPAQPSLPPADPGSSLDFGRCFSFFFQDPDWMKKLLLGSLFTLLSFFIIGWFFVAGYMIRLIRRTARGEAYPLPDWDDLGGIFGDGLAAVGVYLGYILPPIFLFTLVTVGVSLSAAGGGDASVFIAIFATLFSVVFGLAILAVMLFVPSALIRLALDEQFAAAFDFQGNFDFIQRNVANYFLAVLVFILANFISQFGILLFCIGIIPASFWATSVGAYAFGEVAWRDRKAQVEPPKS
jgi:hypothetical protein